MIIHKSNPRDGLLKFVARSEDEFRAYLEGEIEAARMPYARGNAPRLDVGTPASLEPGDDDDELVESAPVPVPRRTRMPSLTKALREARKAGLSVSGATFTADSVTLSFGEATKNNGNDLDQWLAGRHENSTKGH